MLKLLLSKHFKKSIKNINNRYITTTSDLYDNVSCKLLIVGGGSGGCAVAAKFSRKLNKKDLFVLEPSEDHYYQPLFTLIGAGAAKLDDARKNEKDVLPNNCTWIKDKAISYEPRNNLVVTKKGTSIKYEYLLIATGIEPHYEKIPGLLEALNVPIGVCSNYSPKYVNQTYTALKQLTSGNAIFTYPNTSVKCPGAPQKICYLTDHFLRKVGKRNSVTITYNTSLPVIFGVKKYADVLWKICKKRDINVNLRTNLIQINIDKREAVFQNLDNPEIKTVTEFSMLHVTPPMGTSESLNKNKDISNEAGFVDVDKYSLQHIRYPNIFAIGDCSSTPNSKTAAAAAAQSEVVFRNLSNLIEGKPLRQIYDGYASCPIVTGYNRCILAEFDYDLNPLETFPFNQDKEMYTMYFLKKNLMPFLYWYLFLNGQWNGPAAFRKIMHFDFRSKNQTHI